MLLLFFLQILALAFFLFFISVLSILIVVVFVEFLLCFSCFGLASCFFSCFFLLGFHLFFHVSLFFQFVIFPLQLEVVGVLASIFCFFSKRDFCNFCAFHVGTFFGDGSCISQKTLQKQGFWRFLAPIKKMKF